MIDCLSLYLTVSLGSAHINATRELNENNPGIGVGCEIRENLVLEGGGLINSYNDTTSYAIAIMTRDYGKWELGVFGGIAHYPDAKNNINLPSVGDFIPAGGVQAARGPFLIRLIPQDGIISDAVLIFQLRAEF